MGNSQKMGGVSALIAAGRYLAGAILDCQATFLKDDEQFTSPHRYLSDIRIVPVG